jgi:hypothetical protein
VTLFLNNGLKRAFFGFPKNGIIVFQGEDQNPDYPDQLDQPLILLTTTLFIFEVFIEIKPYVNIRLPSFGDDEFNKFSSS